ncbi:peptide deformylase [Paenibacillus sp. 19GGS1-52]|uniref:peptide deformylase n=1 Tax=Paenibacillus sp. 19GGS1-52 TaxID=2758563 RepID=UPI001EFBAED9|nr:peptide deformylase [Paenibacillus sp. 19GGS1-52]ULO10598.1 peptide deformylase [Paenibacillus sp. 19GGS1-52]
MAKFNADYIITMDDIVREGHPVLRTVTEPVKLPPQKEVHEALQCMMQFLKNSQNSEISTQYKLRSGVGISANQIGLTQRMFAMYLTDALGNIVEYALFNPKIISHSLSMVYLPESEGCLSVDRPIHGFVPRYETVKLKAYNLDGKEVVLRFKGYQAIVVQHEIDHLDGIMFFDRINKENPFKLPQGVEIRSLYEQRSK